MPPFVRMVPLTSTSALLKCEHGAGWRRPIAVHVPDTGSRDALTITTPAVSTSGHAAIAEHRNKPETAAPTHAMPCGVYSAARPQ